MKRLFLVLVAIIGITISAVASDYFDKQQIVCNGDKKIVFYTEGTVKVYVEGKLELVGTYRRDRPNVLIITFDRGMDIREASFSYSREGKVTSLSYRGATYTSCY